MKLNIGCGEHRLEGYKGVDITKTGAADIVADINKPWKFAKDETVDEIYASHIVEHVDSLIHFFNESHRVLKKGGILKVIAPYYTSVRCWQDPTHKHAISEHSFLYYNKEWREMNGLSHYPITADFDFGYAFQWHPNWVSRSDEARNWALVHYSNVVTDIHCTLTKR